MDIPLRQYWNLLLKYLRPQSARVAGLAGLLFGGIGLQLANPLLMRDFLDTAQTGGPADTLLRLAGLFTAIALIQQVVAVLATYVSENVAWSATNELRADLAGHCLRLDMSFHNARTPGELIERIDGDVTTLANFFSQFVIQVFGNAVLMLGILALLFREDWRVGAVLSGFVLAALFVLGRLRDIAVPQWKAERQASAELFGFLEERLAGTEDIRANGGQAYTMRHFYRLMRELMSRSLKAGLMVNIMLNSLFLFFALGTAAAFGVGAYLFQREIVTIGAVYIIFHYTRMLERPINQIVHQLGDLQKAGAGIVRIRELLDVQSRISEGAGGRHGSAGGKGAKSAPGVVFQSVSFGYETNHQAHSTNGRTGQPLKEPVLCDLTFRLAPGAVLGLLGRTGSGKTTLTRLLFRLYDPDQGAICLSQDGAPPVDLRELPLQALRRRVGMVTQNIQLFHASVRDNLTFFDDATPDDKILAVLNELGLGEWCAALPNGLDTELESGGGGLSAGQAQLLAFARIFLQDPGLVILDEASSRLDPATENLIERAVDRLVRDRTAIVIAHRLATVQRADEIMILEDGRVIEHGPRLALAADPDSHFAQLLRTGLEEVLA